MAKPRRRGLSREGTASSRLLRGCPAARSPQPSAGRSGRARLPGVRRDVLTGAAGPRPHETTGSEASPGAGVEVGSRTWALPGAGGTTHHASALLAGMAAPGRSPASSAAREGGRKPLSGCSHKVHLSCSRRWRPSFHSDRKASGGRTCLQQDLSWFLLAGSLQSGASFGGCCSRCPTPAAAAEASSQVPVSVRAAGFRGRGQAAYVCTTAGRTSCLWIHSGQG